MYELLGTLILVLGFWALWDELGNIADGSPTARWLDPDELTEDDRRNNDEETRQDFTE